MSTLPALDDLQSKARLSGNLTLDLRLHQQTSTPHLVTPTTTTQEQESRCSHGLFKNCTTVFQCSRFKSDLPTYRPLHKQMSSPSSPGRRWSERSQFCVLFAAMFLSTLAFWAGSLLWNRRYFATSQPNSSAHSPRDHHWHREAVFYEIFPASFLDTDSDGYGDFQGIIRKLDYIRDLGTTAIRLNSIFSALDYPLEYEHIINLRSADPHLGRMDDFRALVRAAHERGLKVVLDLNPTVTSDQHTWALHWQRSIPGYEHFYASANRSKAPPEMENSEGPPPDEWELTQPTFGGHYVLNWSNPFVQEEYRKALDHWLDMGVDGIYMKHLDDLHVLNHHHIPLILRQWRNTLDKSSPRRILIVSSRFADHLVNELSMDRSVLADVDLLDHPLLVGNGEEMGKQVLGLSTAWPEGWPVPMWHLGSSDTFRVASRIEPRYHMAAVYLLMSLPGANSVFYGDEIGLKDSYNAATGRVYRGGQLTPMQWTADNASGGFTDNLTNPWLPINPEHCTNNVENQKIRLQEFDHILSLRKTTLKNYRARNQRVDVLDPNIIVLERNHQWNKSKKIILAANFGNVSEEKEFPEMYGHIRILMTTAWPTRTRVMGRGFTLSPGAAFLAEVEKVSLISIISHPQ